MIEAMGRTRSQLLGLAVVAVMLAAGMAAAGFAWVAGQESEAAPPHPAHIHEGTCDTLNPNPQATLDDVTKRKLDDDKTPTSEDLKGSLTAAEVEMSESEADISFDDVLATAHAINIHESADDIQNYIACGDIGGLVADDKLFIGLRELNDSGYAGVAILEAADDDKTNVTIYLGRGVTGSAAGTTPATPAP